MPVDHVLPHDLDDLYGPGAERADTEAVWYEPVERDYVLRLFRACPLNDVVVIRNGARREYKNVRETRITEIARILRDKRIEFECDFMYYTEISFSFDTERPVTNPEK